MNNKLLAVLAIVIVLAAAFVAIWQFNFLGAPASTDARNIKIGVVAGMQTMEGLDIQRAAQLAVDEINSQGGVYVKDWNKKVNIDLVVADTVDDTAGNTAGPVTRAITDNQVDLLVGGATTGGTLTGQIPAISNRVPFIITGASLNLVTRRGSLPVGNPLRINDTEGMSYMFHYCSTISDYSNTALHFLAYRVKPTLDSTYSFDSSRPLRLAVIYRDDGYGRGVRDVTSSIIATDNMPIQVVANVSYAPTAITYQSQLVQLKESKPDAVYIAGFIADTAEIIKEGINDVGLKSLYIAVDICEDPAFYTLLGQTGSNQILLSKIATQWTGSTWYLPKVGEYVNNYKAKYEGVTPGMLGGDTYDAVYIAKAAIENAGTLDKAAVREQIEKIDMPQNLLIMNNGRITFSTGTNYHETYPISFIEQLIWANGALKPSVVYPDSVPGVSSFKQSDFVLPPDYTPGNP